MQSLNACAMAAAMCAGSDMTACMIMGRACAAECRAHADMDEMCRYSAMARDYMVMKSGAVMASMSA